MPQVRVKRDRQAARQELSVDGATVREALDAAFETHPPPKPRVVDADGRLHAEVVLFVDGGMVEDRVGLTDPVDQDSEVLVMQAT